MLPHASSVPSTTSGGGGTAERRSRSLHHAKSKGNIYLFGDEELEVQVPGPGAKRVKAAGFEVEGSAAAAARLAEEQNRRRLLYLLAARKSSLGCDIAATRRAVENSSGTVSEVKSELSEVKTTFADNKKEFDDFKAEIQRDLSALKKCRAPS